MWQDEGAWIALGVSALFVVAGLVMHRVFVHILKGGPAEPPANMSGSEARSEDHE